MGITSGKDQNASVRTAGKELDNKLSFNTALQHAYDQLELSEKRFRELYDKAPDMYHTLDLEGNFVEFNPKHTEVLGYRPEDLQDHHISCILTEEMLPKLEQEFRELMNSGNINGREYVLRKKDGSNMTVEVHAMRFDGPDGQPREVRCIMRDITQRKQLEAQLVQSQKMECVGQLAGGIAHDFNNLLTAITGYTHMALSIAATDAKLTSYLSQINQATERASTLTRQLLAFSRRQIISPQVINLNDVVTNTEQILCRLISENIKMSISLTPDLGPVNMDPTQVEQVLINLAVNAQDAMPKGGELTITTSNVTLSKRDARRYPDLSPGPFVQLSVADTGIGMDEEVQAHIFEPFFTTKEEGKGTGLGLSMCYGIVKQNNGDIEVESQPGQGSTFKILIPRVEQPATPISQEKESRDLAEGNEAILLVEDNSLVRGLGAKVLRQHGYNVLEAEDGQEALEVAQQYNGEIQLLLTDVVMPNMGVTDLAQQLKATRTGIKVLFTSGYADGSIVLEGVLEPGVEFMKKPYSPADLLERVREVLDH